MKKLGLIVLSFLLIGQAFAAPRVAGFTDNFTVNFPTFNGQALSFSMYGNSDKGTGLQFQSRGCTTTATGTQCNFNIYDKGNGYDDSGNTFVLLTSFPKAYVCQLVIFDGALVSTANLADSNCNPTTMQASMSQGSQYNYTISVANNS